MSASTFFKPENDSVLVLKKTGCILSLGSAGAQAIIPTLLYIPSEKLAISLDAGDQLIKAWETDDIPASNESLIAYNNKLTLWLEQQKKLGNKSPTFPEPSKLLTKEECELGYEKIYLSSERVAKMVYAAKPKVALSR